MVKCDQDSCFSGESINGCVEDEEYLALVLLFFLSLVYHYISILSSDLKDFQILGVLLKIVP